MIPSYNSGAFVGEAVRAALAQTYRPVEIIVVDDGSTDDTRSVLTPFFGRIRYVYQPNRGLSAARNRGIAEANGDLIAFLDADDEWNSDKLALQTDVLRATPRAALVHSDVRYLDNDSGKLFAGRPGRELYVEDCYARLFMGNRVIVSSVLVRRACLDRVGPFDLHIKRPTTQDYDLWLRLARFYEFAYICTPLVRYRIHSTNFSKNALAMTEDELYVVVKALRADSALPARVGERPVRRRLHALYTLLGSLEYYSQSYAAAHQWFRHALHHHPLDSRSLLYWLVTLLPTATVDMLRILKRRFSPTSPAPQGQPGSLS